jgi:hypothetical protein
MLSGALSGLKKVRGAIGRGLQQIISAHRMVRCQELIINEIRRRCLLRVISGHSRASDPCPLSSESRHRQLARKMAFPGKLSLFLKATDFCASEHFLFCSKRLVDSFF